MLNIQKWIDNSILRKKSVNIPSKEITNGKYKELISLMKREIDNPEEWKITLGISAPQIWENIRIIVIREVISTTRKWEIIEDKVYEMINPEILEKSSWTNLDYEGCLSVPWIEDRVLRSNTIKVKYTSEDWVENIREYVGLNARVIQHEIDHLDWVLFTDYLKNRNYYF